MAMNQISINNEEAANAWMRKAEDLNNRTKNALDGLAKDLEEIGNGAEGEIVQQFIDTATDVYANTNKILEGMNGLLSVVGNIMKNFVTTLSGLATEGTHRLREIFH